MDRRKTVSVIIPTRNRAGFLRRALESVLDQRLAPGEVIVVDDASTDETRKVPKCYPDLPVRYIGLSERKGAAHARNRGIEAARGRYIAFLDDDDVWLPDKLQLQVARLEEGGERLGLVCCAYRVTCFSG